MHRYLVRLFGKHGCSLSEAPSLMQWQQVVLKLHDILEEEDSNRKILEHSLRVVSDEMQELYREQRELSETQAAILQAQPDLMLVVDENGKFSQLLAGNRDLLARPPEEFIGKHLQDVFSKDHARFFSAAMRRALNSDELSVVEYDMDVPIGKRKFEARITPIKAFDAPVKSVVVLVRDITERAEAAEKLAWEATHDALTGLANRRAFEQCLPEVISRCKANGHIGALLYVDVDDMKEINDRHGHSVGDEVLRVLAQRLRNSCRPRDLVARIGGDEFMVVADGLAAEEQINSLVEQFSGCCREPVHVRDIDIKLSFSVGVATISGDDADEAALVDMADRALYATKRAGKNGFKHAAGLDRNID